MHLVPTVIEKTNQREYAYDIYSRLLEDRIILLTGTIDDKMASSIVGQLLYLESLDNTADIYMYINSPGGSINAFLLSAGAKGKRCSLPNSEIMIHQPLGAYEGQASDIEISAKRILKQKEKLNKILSQNTNQPLAKIKSDTDRDFFLEPIEALEYGLIDEIIG